jgi:hypothetical protein
MKLELKHLAVYLPYGLKVRFDVEKYKDSHQHDLVGLELDLVKVKTHIGIVLDFPEIERVKPILRPLSDLTKEITHNGETFVPIEEYHYLRFEEISNYKSGGIWLNHIHFREYNVLIELHFDVFGLIDNGLAIDINTLES